jgi:hypothetical protein
MRRLGIDPLGMVIVIVCAVGFLLATALILSALIGLP